MLTQIKLIGKKVLRNTDLSILPAANSKTFQAL